MKKLILVAAGLALVVIGFVSLVKFSSIQSSQSKYDRNEQRPWQDYQTVLVQMYRQQTGEVITEFQVLVVVSGEALRLGLSGRDTMPEQGMLFVLPERQVASFWMKEMKFDLDMVWIDGKTIVGITEAVPKPEPDTPTSQLPHYSSVTPVTMVLELPSGFSARHELRVGDRVVLGLT